MPRGMEKSIKQTVLTALCLLLSVILCISFCALILAQAVSVSVAAYILSTEQLEEQNLDFDCILILGCRVYSDGRMSDMLADRVQTGVRLYEGGLAPILLMSGDRSADGSYDEVGAMRNFALSMGVPDEAIAIDPCGYSTYESVLRAKETYGFERILIVTQEYHLSRALYIARKMGVSAYGVSADLRSYAGQWKRDLREIPARLKDMWQVQVEWGKEENDS